MNSFVLKTITFCTFFSTIPTLDCNERDISMYFSYLLISKEHFQLADHKKKFSLPPGKHDIFNHFHMIFSVWRWQKEVFPSTWTNDSTWGIYICSCSVYEGWLQQRWWWREYKINNKCYFVSPGSTSSYFSRNSSWRTIFSRIWQKDIL